MELARIYNVHPNTIVKWKAELMVTPVGRHHLLQRDPGKGVGEERSATWVTRQRSLASSSARRKWRSPS